jgi:hypothetical protein
MPSYKVTTLETDSKKDKTNNTASVKLTDLSKENGSVSGFANHNCDVPNGPANKDETKDDKSDEYV